MDMPDKESKKELTVMFYFASDNPIAPTVISQLKAIKQAGMHQDVNVVTQFDPRTVGTPTHIFEVNLVNKLKEQQRRLPAFSTDPFYRNMYEDKLWRNQRDRNGSLVKARLRELLDDELGGNSGYDPPEPPNDRLPRRPGGRRRGRRREPSPRASLRNFLKLCSTHYKARHYMLFILGHGVLVANDLFLFDENADEEQSLSLEDLHKVLLRFKGDIAEHGGQFDLISFNSCSVSAAEVAYQLQDTALYMLASQGPTFVGSWPYREILEFLFHCRRRPGDEPCRTLKKTLLRIFALCVQNSTDFLMAGYSYDLCLCDLSKVARLKRPIQRLSQALERGLRLPLARNLILLAHWQSQSFWQESYTDLADFCFCLRRLSRDYQRSTKQRDERTDDTLNRLKERCRDIENILKSEFEPGGGVGPIVRAEFAGPAFQFSRGLSIFFPWSRPSADSEIMEEYEKYRFEETGWRNFLELYFRRTKRRTRKQEDNEPENELETGASFFFDEFEGEGETSSDNVEEQPAAIQAAGEGAAGVAGNGPRPRPREEENERVLLFEDMVALCYNDEGEMNLRGPKTHPDDPLGDDCSYPIIKNHPIDIRASRERAEQVDEVERAAPVSRELTKGFIG